MFKQVYNFFTAVNSRSWTAHGLAVLIPSFIVGWVVSWFGDGGLGAMLIVATFGLAFYGIKEILDVQKHKAAGTWDKASGEDQVTKSVDLWGDLLAPIFIWLTTFACWLIG